MVNRRFKNALAVAVIAGMVTFACAGEALAWKSHSNKHHSRHKKTYRSSSYIFPILKSLTGLYYYSLPRKEEVTVYVTPPSTGTITTSTARVRYSTTGDTMVVYVPNTNGSYTKVALQKIADGYIGPQGEYYPEHPTVAQLRVLNGN